MTIFDAIFYFASGFIIAVALYERRLAGYTLERLPKGKR